MPDGTFTTESAHRQVVAETVGCDATTASPTWNSARSCRREDASGAFGTQRWLAGILSQHRQHVAEIQSTGMYLDLHLVIAWSVPG